MAYGLSNCHVTDDVTWPPKVLWGSTVGYPSDSLASCQQTVNIRKFVQCYRHNVLLASSNETTVVSHQPPSVTDCWWFCLSVCRWISIFLSLHLGRTLVNAYTTVMISRPAVNTPSMTEILPCWRG